MKQQVLFIHGGEAFSDYNAFLKYLAVKEIHDPLGLEKGRRWSKTLREDLGDACEVYMPQMPNSWNAKYEEWKIWFERHFEFLRDGVILIGHSQGGYFLAKYFTENEVPFHVKALYLLASPFRPDDFGDEDGGDFAFDTAQVGNIADRVERIYILHSADDPIVPFAHGEQFAAALPVAEFVRFEDKGHFLGEEFPELIQSIRGLE